MPELLIDALAFFVKSYITLGPVFRVVAPTRSYLVMAGMDATRLFLSEDGNLFDHTPLYQGVATELRASHYPISTSGNRHRHLRHTIKPAFATDTLAAAAPAIIEEIGSRARRWACGTRLPGLEFLHELLGNVVIPALIGRPIGNLLKDAVRFARFSVGTGLGAYPAEFRFAPHYQFSRRRMFPFFQDILAQHRKHPAGRDRAPDFVDHMLEMQDEHGAPLTDDNVVALAQMALSNTLLYVAPSTAFLISSLLASPAARARCEREIDDAFVTGIPDLARLQACTYLHASMTESMRMHPIGLAAPRVVTKSFCFEGYTIPADTPVLFANSAAHYLPEFYPAPYRFEPERHLPPRQESRRPGVFAPLGLGSHSCLAARLVEAMTLLVVSALFRHVRFEFDVPGYTLRKRVNPFPEPTSDLVFRVAAHRA